jgi:hypothetical protein
VYALARHAASGLTIASSTRFQKASTLCLHAIQALWSAAPWLEQAFLYQVRPCPLSHFFFYITLLYFDLELTHSCLHLHRMSTTSKRCGMSYGSSRRTVNLRRAAVQVYARKKGIKLSGLS